MNPEISLDIFIPPSPAFENVHLLKTHDRHGLNNGVFMIEINDWSVKLLTAVLAFHHFRPMVELKYSEQSAMEEMLKDVGRKFFSQSSPKARNILLIITLEIYERKRRQSTTTLVQCVSRLCARKCQSSTSWIPCWRFADSFCWQQGRQAKPPHEVLDRDCWAAKIRTDIAARAERTRGRDIYFLAESTADRLAKGTEAHSLQNSVKTGFDNHPETEDTKWSSCLLRCWGVPHLLMEVIRGLDTLILVFLQFLYGI